MAEKEDKAEENVEEDEAEDDVAEVVEVGETEEEDRWVEYRLHTRILSSHLSRGTRILIHRGIKITHLSSISRCCINLSSSSRCCINLNSSSRWCISSSSSRSKAPVIGVMAH